MYQEVDGATLYYKEYGSGDKYIIDVYEFARRKGIEKFLYTGQSHGAGIGWHLALRHPEVLELRKEFEGKAEKAYEEELNRTEEELRINPRKPLSYLKTDEEVYEELSKIQIPVLMINGFQDDVVPVTDIIWPIKVIKNSKCIIYHDAGHGIHYDYREDIRREIALFASGLF